MQSIYFFVYAPTMKFIQFCDVMSKKSVMHERELYLWFVRSVGTVRFCDRSWPWLILLA